jgi:hypothetical protein
VTNEKLAPCIYSDPASLLGPTSPSGYVSVQYIIINSGRLLLLEANSLI